MATRCPQLHTSSLERQTGEPAGEIKTVEGRDGMLQVNAYYDDDLKRLSYGGVTAYRAAIIGRVADGTQRAGRVMRPSMSARSKRWMPSMMTALASLRDVDRLTQVNSLQPVPLLDVVRGMSTHLIWSDDEPLVALSPEREVEEPEERAQPHVLDGQIQGKQAIQLPREVEEHTSKGFGYVARRDPPIELCRHLSSDPRHVPSLVHDPWAVHPWDAPGVIRRSRHASQEFTVSPGSARQVSTPKNPYRRSPPDPSRASSLSSPPFPLMLVILGTTDRVVRTVASENGVGAPATRDLVPSAATSQEIAAASTLDRVRVCPPAHDVATSSGPDVVVLSDHQ